MGNYLGHMAAANPARLTANNQWVKGRALKRKSYKENVYKNKIF